MNAISKRKPRRGSHLTGVAVLAATCTLPGDLDRCGHLTVRRRPLPAPGV